MKLDDEFDPQRQHAIRKMAETDLDTLRRFNRKEIVRHLTCPVVGVLVFMLALEIMTHVTLHRTDAGDWLLKSVTLVWLAMLAALQCAECVIRIRIVAYYWREQMKLRKRNEEN